MRIRERRVDAVEVGGDVWREEGRGSGRRGESQEAAQESSGEEICYKEIYCKENANEEACCQKGCGAEDFKGKI